MNDSIQVAGNEYISTRRAAEISKYSNDYIGQLCREGRVPARMVGRSWFIKKEALLDHKKLAEEALSQNGRNHVLSAQHKHVVAFRNEIRKESPIPVVKHNTQGLLTRGISYSADDRPLMPQLIKKVQTTKPSRIHKRSKNYVTYALIVILFTSSLGVSVYAFSNPGDFIQMISSVRAEMVKIAENASGAISAAIIEFQK